MRSVTVCASKKYAEEVAQFSTGLESKGVLVFQPNFKEPVWETEQVRSEHITKVVFKGLTLEHFDWLRKGDVCFIYNKDNYVGVSVSMEMAYASALGKPVIALQAETGDPCRNALIDKTAESPEALLKYLT